MHGNYAQKTRFFLLLFLILFVLFGFFSADFHKRIFLQAPNESVKMHFFFQRIQMSVAPHATPKRTTPTIEMSGIFLISARPWNQKPKLNRGVCLMQIWWAFIVRIVLLAY